MAPCWQTHTYFWVADDTAGVLAETTLRFRVPLLCKESAFLYKKQDVFKQSRQWPYTPLPNDQAPVQEAASMAAAARVPTWFEPVSVPKAARAAGALHLLECISPNAAELISISEALASDQSTEQYQRQHQAEQSKEEPKLETTGEGRVMKLRHHIKRVLDAGVKSIVLTLGSDGAALCTLR